MLQRVMEWERSRPMWIRCFVWALLLYLLLLPASFQVVFSFHVPYLWALLPSMVGALLMGVHLRSWTWAGTPLAVGAVVVAPGALLLVSGLGSLTSFTPGAQGYVVALGAVLTAAGVVFGVAHALPAAAGVWWGQRREATKVGSSESSLDGDASTETML
jgi:hypothetical protein